MICSSLYWLFLIVRLPFFSQQNSPLVTSSFLGSGHVPSALIVVAGALYLLRQARHKNEFQGQRLGHVLHTGLAKTRLTAHQLEPNMRRHAGYGLTQKLRRAIGARTVAPAPSVVGDKFAFGQSGDQRPMARVEFLPDTPAPRSWDLRLSAWPDHGARLPAVVGESASDAESVTTRRCRHGRSDADR